MKRFLLVQFGHFGDCLYATTLAQQIKHDNPDCHLTWAIAPKFQSILTMNPHVDAILTVPYMYSDIPFDKAWEKFHSEIKEKYIHSYNTIIVSQLACDNLQYYDGSIRSSILKTYQKEISVPVTPVVILTDEEIQNVNFFVDKNHIKKFKNIVLFECSPQSSQSSMNIEFAEKVSRELVNKFSNTCFLVSSPFKLNKPTSQIIDASELSFRENAELANHCTLLVGCSSGITWITTSIWTKKINTIQIINPSYDFHASVAYDAHRFHLPFDHILEIIDAEKEILPEILEQAITGDFNLVRKKYHRKIEPSVKKFALILTCVATRNGYRASFATYLNMLKKNKSLCPFKLLFYTFYYNNYNLLLVFVEHFFPASTTRRKVISNFKKQIFK